MASAAAPSAAPSSPPTLSAPRFGSLRRTAALLPGKRSWSTAGGNFFDITDGPIMQHSDEKILTTHVGSLIRPPEFVALLQAADAGEPGAASRYPAELKEAVAQIVREQAAIGINVVSDG